ncbi:hypothetical protein ACHQM5_028079 [Ranunculus cassubicifolius]
MAVCPVNSIRFNSTLCACIPGYLFNSTTKNCSEFVTSPSDWQINSGIDYSINFPVTIFSFDSLKKFTKSQTVFLEATLVLLVSWLLFCLVVRFKKVKVGDGDSHWFRVRWWISRLDVCYATRHWLDDQKVVRKRKTELGGTFSIASWILFIGLLSALLYQIISRRTIEVRSVRSSNGPELLSFDNDMEFNITTISSMSCSQLRGLGTLVTGTPLLDYKTFPLSNFLNYSCYNTSQGPTIRLNCSSCKFVRDYLYISWQFVDLPNNPATAVGFEFNFTAKNHRDKKRTSVISGIVKNGSIMDDLPRTFRGLEVNVLKFNLFPRIYRNLHHLKIIQPLFHEFIPGSTFLGSNELQASLQGSQDGLINTTLAVNFLSAYIIEIDTENMWGLVSFFSDLGGLYAFSFAIFFYFLMQCEYRIKKLRNEDKVLLNIRNRSKAKRNWDKLRKYVMYTWGCNTLDDANTHNGKKSRSLRKRNHNIQMDTIKRNDKETTTDLEKGLSHSDTKMVARSRNSGVPDQREVSQPQASIRNDGILPLPPKLELKMDSEIDLSDIQRSFENLYKYNVLLREKFIASQSKIEELTEKASRSTR